MADTKSVVLNQWAGASDGWTSPLPLQAWPVERVEVDATAVRFVVPTFLLRLRTFVDWHLAEGREVVVLGPKDFNVGCYLARMRVNRGLPTGTFPDLPQISEHDQRDVLVPITRLSELTEVDVLAQDLSQLVFAQHADLAFLADAIHMGVSELCANAVEHGESPHGCYVAAQRYGGSRPRSVLAIGDLGVGIPSHVRRLHPDLTPDQRAIEEATKPGISGAQIEGGTPRGYGFHHVFEEARAAAALRYAALEIRSGKGLYRAKLSAGGDLQGQRRRHGNKRGSWVTLELGT